MRSWFLQFSCPCAKKGTGHEDGKYWRECGVGADKAGYEKVAGGNH